MQTEQRYTITAVIAWHDTEHRIPLGTATSRRKARRLGYREGKYHYPLLSTSSVFSIDIVDEVTGERVSTDWVEYEAYLRAQELETVGQRGVW